MHAFIVDGTSWVVSWQSMAVALCGREEEFNGVRQ